MATALVGMGSNLGDRQAALEAAVAALASRADLRVAAVSGFRETAPIGGPQDQPAYLNAALRLETELDPRSLLHVLQGVENELGRVRNKRWGPRTVDLDLLLYDELTLDTPALTLPHPRMSFRRFVLAPAAEVGGEMVHPTTGWTVSRLLEHLKTAKPYVAVVARPWPSQFVQALARSVDAEPIWFPWRDFGGAIKGVQHATDRSPVAQMLGKRSRVLIEVAESLDPAKWRTDGKLRVSDFWLDFFRRNYAGLEGRSVCEAIDAAALPKLLIAWLPPIDEQRELAQATPDGREAVRRGVESFRAFLREPGHGPLLYLETPDFDAALAEAIAAVRAMD